MTARTATAVVPVVERVETDIDNHRDCGVRAGGAAASRRMGRQRHRWRVPRVRGGALRALVPAVVTRPGCQATLVPVVRVWRATFDTIGTIACFARLARFPHSCRFAPSPGCPSASCREGRWCLAGIMSRPCLPAPPRGSSRGSHSARLRKTCRMLRAKWSQEVRLLHSCRSTPSHIAPIGTFCVVEHVETDIGSH